MPPTTAPHFPARHKFIVHTCFFPGGKFQPTIFPHRILQRAHRRHHIDINCVDSLGRGALTIAIDGENLEMVELLVIMGVQTKDALLQAINAEFVEAVELLLEHEELIHGEGELYVSDRICLRLAIY